jgi:hypothetical protein
MHRSKNRSEPGSTPKLWTLVAVPAAVCSTAAACSSGTSSGSTTTTVGGYSY